MELGVIGRIRLELILLKIEKLGILKLVEVELFEPLEHGRAE